VGEPGPSTHGSAPIQAHNHNATLRLHRAKYSS
jgi:hypothetical protein